MCADKKESTAAENKSESRTVEAGCGKQQEPDFLGCSPERTLSRGCRETSFPLFN